MNDEEKKLARFGFTSPDECVGVSQCVECVYNIGKTCKMFGSKPKEYARAYEKTACPKRKKAGQN